MPASDLLYDVHDVVALITFNRPDALNALRQRTMDELHDALQRAESDASLRAVVLTGAGRAFCAGRDLKEADALSVTPARAADVAAVVERYQELTRRLTRMDKVVISAINGVAVGIGAELAAASDIRLGATEARIAFPEMLRALFLTNGVLYRLPRIVGLGRATEWIMSGRMIESAEMLASGFVSQLLPGADLVAVAMRLAATIAANAPIPMRMAKDLLNRSYDLDLGTILDAEQDALIRCVLSDDYGEGIRAFIEKRPPKFNGR